MAYVAVNYFITVGELTARNTVSAHEEVVQYSPSSIADTLLPFIPYAPFVLSGLLFIIAFGMFFMERVHNWKNVMTAVIVALMVAGIPAILTYVGQGSRQTANAGPEEIPRNVSVAPVSPTSVLISWNTDAARIGAVRFGKTPLTSQNARIYIADNQESASKHTVEINFLEKKQSYEFEILSGATWYDNGSKYIRFTVL